MTVTLGWLLAQRELDLRLVSGSAAATEVNWAHAIDVVDPTPWLSGGEFVLTTGLRLSRSVRDQRAYVERLAHAGIAGLGFGVGERYDRIPRAVAGACAELGLALVEVPPPTPFIAIIQAVTRRLSQQEVAALQQALTYQQRITRSAVRGGLAGLVTVLGRELRCDAAVLDEYGATMASSTREGRFPALVTETWRERAHDARRGVMGVTTDEGLLEVQTLRGRSTVVGWLAVRWRHGSSPTDRLVLNQAAGLITLQLDWPAELIAAYHSLGGTLLDLMIDPGHAAAEQVQHLRHFGFQPEEPVMLAVATAVRGHARILEIVSETLEKAARPHVVTAVDGGVALLLQALDADLLTGLLAHALEEAGVDTVVIGVSGSLPQSAVATGLGPARQAADAARREKQRIGWFDQLTLSTLIADDAVRSRIWALARPALDVLLREPGPRAADLVPSLEAYLQHNGAWEPAARALGVHRHTLRARMARVEELTGLRVDDAETRVLLLLALMSRPGG